MSSGSSPPAEQDETSMLAEYDNKYGDHEDAPKHFEPIEADFGDLLKGCHNIKDAVTLLQQSKKEDRNPVAHQILHVMARFTETSALMLSGAMKEIREVYKQDQEEFKKLDVEGNYQSVMVMERGGKNINTETQKLARTLLDRWGIHPRQFPYWD
jgi:hypothetical protein